MNRTVVFVTFALLAALGLIGALVLTIERPDATATFTAYTLTILALVASAAGTFYGLGKLNDKTETLKEEVRGVARQSNGNLSVRDQEIARLRQLALSKGIDPGPGIHER